MISTAPILTAVTGPASMPDLMPGCVLGVVGTATPDVTGVLDSALALVEQYVADRGEGVSDGRTELSVLRKWVFWLATGQFPTKGLRGAFVWTAVTTAPGWTPVAPADAQDWMIQCYTEILFEAGNEGSSGRDVCLMSGFYQWLLNIADTPVAAYRRRYKPSTPTRSSSGQDRFYSAQHSARLLAAAEELLCQAHENAQHSRGAVALQRAQVDHMVAWLLWGTGASAAALCALNITDINLQDMTITWPTAPEDAHTPEDSDSDRCGDRQNDHDDDDDDGLDSDDDDEDDEDEAEAGYGDDRDGDDAFRRSAAPAGARPRPALVQPLPPPLVEVLGAYLREVRPGLATPDGRLLANPHGQGDGKHLTARRVQDITKGLAAKAKLLSLPGAHTPQRWKRAYAMRILEAPLGSMIPLMKLEDRSAYVGLERLYGSSQPDLHTVSIEDVFGPARHAG